MYSKLSEEHSLGNVARLRYIFLAAPDESEKYAKMIHSNSSNNCVRHFNVEIVYLFEH